MRTFAKYLLAVVGGVLAVLALTLTSTWMILGSPSNIATTAMKVVQSPEGRAAVGDLFVEQLLSGADPQTTATLEPKRVELASAAGTALGQQGEVVDALITTVVDATSTGQATRLDLTPLLGPVLMAMNGVDAQVPTSVDGDMAMDLNPAELPPLAGIMSGLGMWWVIVVVAIAALVGAAFCDRRGGFRRFRVSGITLGIAALIVMAANIGGSVAGSGMAMDDPRATALVGAVIAVVRSTIITVSGLALAIAIIVIVLSIVIKPKTPPQQVATSSE